MLFDRGLCVDEVAALESARSRWYTGYTRIRNSVLATLTMRNGMFVLGKRRIGVMALALALIFAISPIVLHAQEAGFTGVQLGMPADAALKKLKRPSNFLASLPWIAGKRIVVDTMKLTDCALEMRRSVGFDSTNAVAVIGLTHKTTPDQVDSTQKCALRWLRGLFGTPTSVEQDDASKIYVWADATSKLTLEAKGYNEHDFFLLIYWFFQKKN